MPEVEGNFWHNPQTPVTVMVVPEALVHLAVHPLCSCNKDELNRF